MKIHKKVSITDIPYFSKLIADYFSKSPALEDFYDKYPEIENFEKQIKSKQFPENQRLVLVKALQKQNEKLPLSQKTTLHIEQLAKENTFTVLTAHQPTIFLNPLYFVYKIITTIKLSQTLAEKYPAYNFVPIFWIGSEDHDFEEISYVRLFGKKYQWQSEQKGAVGRMQPQTLLEVYEQLPEKLDFFKNAYQNFDTLSEATAYLINHLFGQYGLVVMSGDDSELKKQFLPIAFDELNEQKTFQKVGETSNKLAEKGYKAQVSPREINLFYLENNLRERIVQENNLYKVLHTDLSFTQEQLKEVFSQNPEKCSPNAILRCVYQESILPNLAYVGGPGELAYWLQLKETFAYHQKNCPHLQFPILVPRTFALVLQENQLQKIEKLNLAIEDFFFEEIFLRKQLLAKNTTNTLDLEPEKQKISTIFEEIKQKSLAIDKSLEGSIAAEAQKIAKILEGIEKKLQKAEEKKQETEILQAVTLKEKLFPNGNLQERTDNFMNFYLNEPSFLANFMNLVDVFDFNFQVLTLDKK
ncbi:MAG: bacillithiol biosynthesis cysteine-adding enzyme BshC [Thermonemataceae bacterium]|nr:bacillithiol biosynthesis cysteine-adding enzyme BshC [Thermonemataceae bacterium]